MIAPSETARFGMPGCIVMLCRRCDLNREVPFDHGEWPVLCARCGQPMISHRVIKRGQVKAYSFLGREER